MEMACINVTTFFTRECDEMDTDPNEISDEIDR